MELLLIIILVATSFWWIPMILFMVIVVPLFLLGEFLKFCGVDLLPDKKKETR